MALSHGRVRDGKRSRSMLFWQGSTAGSGGDSPALPCQPMPAVVRAAIISGKGRSVSRGVLAVTTLVVTLLPALHCKYLWDLGP